MSQLLIMKNTAPLLQSFVSREENGFTLLITLINHLKNDIRRIWTIAEVAHFIYHQYVWRNVVFQRTVDVSVSA